MENLYENLDIGIDLTNASVMHYEFDYNLNNLLVKIKAINAKKIEFIFFDVLAFNFTGLNSFSNFIKNHSHHSLLQEGLMRLYEQTEKKFDEKLFQFLSSTNEVCLEIACKRFESAIIEN